MIINWTAPTNRLAYFEFLDGDLALNYGAFGSTIAQGEIGFLFSRRPQAAFKDRPTFLFSRRPTFTFSE